MEQREQTLRLIAIFVAGAVGLLVLRLWSLQVIHAERYRILAENNRIRSAPISAPRGLLLDRTGVPLVKNTPVYRLLLQPEIFSQTPVRMQDMASLLRLPVETLVSQIGQFRDNEPVNLEEGLTFETVARVETRRFEFPELEVRAELGRKYPYGETAAHVLGYLGRLRPDQLGEEQYIGLPPDTQVGQWGVERLFDGPLRGEPGRKIFEVNAMGRKTRVLDVQAPDRGTDLRLSLDMRTQRAAEQGLGKRHGAVVALDPRTGEVLALVSHPSFDPNLFAEGISSDAWQQLLQNPATPLFNRAIQSRYPPGSTFKLVVAAAALETGAITPQDKIFCKGSIQVGTREFKCWEKNGHGSVNLNRAIAESCDVYFYEVGARIGIDTIVRYAAMLGLNGKPDLGIPQEAAGLIPTPQWKRSTLGEPWFPGDTVNTAIGQGYVGVSPFLLALAYAAVATGGPVPHPTLIAGQSLPPLSVPAWSPSTFALLQEGLREAVQAPRGTGKQAASPWFSTAGKTGTAQVIGIRDTEKPGEIHERDHAWFVGYAPADDPRIVVTVLVEHGGHGGSAAAPVARDIFEAYLAPEGPLKPSTQP